MSNKMTRQEYDRLKNERYEVIVFENGIRIMSYGNLSAIKALEEVQFHSRKSPYLTALVFNEQELIDPETGRKDTCTAWEQSYYEKFSMKGYRKAKEGLNVLL